MPGVRGLAAGLVLCPILLAGCGGTTTPTPVPPVSTEPTITCPGAQTAQSSDGKATAVTFAVPAVANGQPPLTTTCTPQSGSLFAIGQDTVTCTVTDALKRANSCIFTVTVLSPPPVLSATQFLSFGDSVTYGEDGQQSIASSIELMRSRVHPAFQVPLPQRYPTVLLQSLTSRYKTQSFKVENAGNPGEAAGDNTANPTAVVRFIGLVGSRAYQVVLILEGSNDIFYGDPNAEQPAIDGLRVMLRYAKSQSVRPYLATIPPMVAPNPRTSCDPVCRGGGFALVNDLNDRIRTLATTEGVTLVDVNQAFGGNLALIGPDGLHPNANGYAKIADTFFKAITTTLEVPFAATGAQSLRRPASTLRR